MSYYWNMSADIGSQPNSTYQYEARDGACRNQAGKPIASRATRRGDYFVRGLQNIKDALQDGPLSVAVSAGNSCWRYYQSGILSEKNNCPTRIDHGVALVGLDESGEMVTSVKCPKSYKEYFTVIKNVKKAHEINDFGENQEFNDDVDYILDGLSRYWKLCQYDECG